MSLRVLISLIKIPLSRSHETVLLLCYLQFKKKIRKNPKKNPQKDLELLVVFTLLQGFLSVCGLVTIG